MIFDSDSWASAAADALKNNFSKPEHSLTVKAKSGGATAKSTTSLNAKGVNQKVKFGYSVQNVKIKKLEFGTKEQSVAVSAEFSNKLHGVDGLTVTTDFTSKGHTNLAKAGEEKRMGASKDFTVELAFTGIKDLGITASTNALELSKGNVNGEAALEYKFGDATLGCNVSQGDGLQGQFAAQYNGGDWKAVLKSNCADGNFADVAGYKHSLGFTANVGSDTTIFGQVTATDDIAIGGTQKVDSKASLAWKADMKDISLKYKHKLTNSLELGAGTSLPYVTSVTGVNFDLTYTP